MRLHLGVTQFVDAVEGFVVAPVRTQIVPIGDDVLDFFGLVERFILRIPCGFDFLIVFFF